MKSILLAALLGLPIQSVSAAPPNILFIFIDDIGWGDMSCYGSPVLDKSGHPITPRLDALAAQGTRFTHGYVASPICSPSRVGVMTGAEPARHAIYSFLDNKAANASRNMNDWLQPDTVTAPRIFQKAGYATGQFGKWHMGGGRDVNDAPFPQAYGFNNSLVAFEGMGDRVLYQNKGVRNDGLSNQNADVPGAITWAEWEQGADLHAAAAINFMTAAVNANKPFYVHVPFNDTHSPYNTDPGKENDFDHITTNTNGKLFLSELHELDKVVGNLVDAVDALGVANNTLIVIIGDNGAPDDNLNAILNRNGGLKGGKGNLFEGGIREPFFIRMPGTVPAGVVNSTTAVSTLDLLPTYCALAGVPIPDAPLAGENMSDVFKGSTRARTRPLFWEFGTVSNLTTESPKLAVREGDYKLMRNPDGSNRQFYNVATDRNETANLIGNADLQPTISAMEEKLVRWNDEVVLGNVGTLYNKSSGLPAEIVIADSYDLPGGNSAGTGFTVNTGVNQGLATRLSGALASQLSYRQNNTAKAASAHSISGNTLTVANAANSTAFQFSGDGTSSYDFGPILKGRTYEWRITLDLDDPSPASARMSLSISDAPGAVVNDVDLGLQLKLETNNTTSVYKRIDAASISTGADINTTIATGLLAGAPVSIRVVMQDSTDYASFLTHYEVFVNGVSKDSGNIRFANDSRYLIFDTAPNTGPARYDNFAIETLTPQPTVQDRIPTLRLSEFAAASVLGADRVRLYWTTRPGEVVRPVVSGNLSSWQPVMENGVPLVVSTDHGTIRWKDVEVPAGFHDRAFFRLEKN